MEVISVFSGAGGMDYGLLQSGHDIVLAVDKDMKACETYEKNLQIKPICDDIKNVNKYPNADLLVACCPCQGFSMFGNRKYNDSRNFLYREIIRYLNKVKPKYLIMENVKGLLKLYKKNFFNMMIKDFFSAGYRLKWKLINAKYYGVPQDRLRIFIVGVRKDIKFTFNFPMETHGYLIKSADHLMLSQKDIAKSEYMYEYNDCFQPFVTLQKSISGMCSPKKGEYWDSKKYSYFYMSRNRRRSWDEVSYTIQASGRHIPLHPSSPPMKFIEKDRWAFTEDITKYRRLSVPECAVIQSFPKDFSFSGGINSKYRQIGNAVPPLVSYQIGLMFNRLEKC